MIGIVILFVQSMHSLFKIFTVYAGVGKTCDHHAENADRLSLEELLCFISGARSIPPLEFNFSIEVTFFSDCKKVYPKASTCIPAIRLPYHPSYKEFKAAMVEAIVGGSCVFGQL